MLKIKNDIDLKELEKYGIYECLSWCGKFEGYGDKYQDIFIYKDNKEIDTGGHLDEMDLGKHDVLLYDLIKADLVEKIEE